MNVKLTSRPSADHDTTELPAPPDASLIEPVFATFTPEYKGRHRPSWLASRRFAVGTTLNYEPRHLDTP